MRSEPTSRRCVPAGRAAGFSLLEVLIAILVSSVGLLGLAALQTTGLRTSHSSYLTTQAVQFANEMVDRMRANMDGVNDGDYDALAYPGPGAAPSCVGGPAGCADAGDMAQNDHHEWQTALSDTLPAGRGQVTGAGGWFTITVMWDNHRTGAVGTGCGNDPQVDLTCYSLTVRMGV